MISNERGESDVWVLNCPNGHKVMVVSRNRLFDIHFDLAVRALVRESWRESFIHLVASVETFHAYIVQLNLIKIGVFENKSIWNVYENSSERQLGAFQMLLTQQANHKENCVTVFEKTIDRKTFASRRNIVIHKGQFPLQAHLKRLLGLFLSTYVTVFRFFNQFFKMR